MQEMLKITGIRKSFSTLDVLKGVDLTVHKGEVVSLIGPSGSGKTTLLRCANFLDQAEDGTMVLDGQTYHLGHVRRTEMYEARRHTAFVFQNYNLFLNKTALQNVTEGLIVARKMPRDEAEARAQKALEKVGLKENVIIGKLIPAGSGLKAYRDFDTLTTPESIVTEEMIDDEKL